MAWKEICTISTLMFMLTLPCVNASDDTLSDLRMLISGFEDTNMNANDLAFYLATHGFDASPKGGLVEVKLSGQIHKLRPNGSAPGLCSLE